MIGPEGCGRAVALGSAFVRCCSSTVARNAVQVAHALIVCVVGTLGLRELQDLVGLLDQDRVVRRADHGRP